MTSARSIKKLLALLCFFPISGWAQWSANPAQGLQPSRTNFLSRSSGVVYDYGYPSCTGCGAETGVEFQVLADEASGNITDEVNSIILTAVGSATYSQALTAHWARLSPGILLDGSSNCFKNSSAQSVLNIGNGEDFVLEFVGEMDSGVSNGDHNYLLSLNGQASATNYGILWYINPSGATTTLVLYLRSDTTAADIITDVVGQMSDDRLRKFRAAVDRSANATQYINGVGQGPASVSAHATEVYTNAGIGVGCQYNNGGADWTGRFYEARITVGNATNCSASGGDCQ